ncbi:MAG: SMC-Scp complex subunit ScpB [Patescibacteria group bacterium]
MSLPTNHQQLETSLEALLFYKGEPVKIRDLAASLHASESDIQNALSSLGTALEGRGIRLVREGEYAGLATAPETKSLIDAVRKEELEGPLGKAGLETLAIILYHGPLSKTDIEYIRGVNSSSILRSLLIRGLVEKTEHPSDKRSFLYRGTPELPASLGISSLSDAPDFEKIKAEIQNILDERPAPTEETHE